VINRAAGLHAAIVPAADDLALVHEDRSDRNAALGEALPGLLESGLEKGIRIVIWRLLVVGRQTVGDVLA
jgi:hypothetical protein